MKSFLLKYKRTIIFWMVFSAIVLYFAPRQHDYYLDDDIDSFKKTYMTPFLLWTGIVISIVVLILVFVKTRSFKQAGLSFLSVGVTLAIYLFIFQDLFLGSALFINRLSTHDTLNKSYVISYMAGTKQNKDNFILYDLSTNQSANDRKLKNKIYRSALKQNDTVILRFDKGLFWNSLSITPFE